MEILLNLSLCDNLPAEESLELSFDDKEEIRKRAGFKNICDVQLVNIGPGADFIVLLLILDISLSILQLGTVINDGIDGWVGIGKKLKNLFQRHKIVSIDSDGATSMAIELIARHETITSLEKIQDTTINLVDVSGMIPLNSNLSAKLHNYYIQAYRINNEDIYVIGITSSGEVSIIKHFGFNPYGIDDIK